MKKFFKKLGKGKDKSDSGKGSKKEKQESTNSVSLNNEKRPSIAVSAPKVHVDPVLPDYDETETEAAVVPTIVSKTEVLGAAATQSIAGANQLAYDDYDDDALSFSDDIKSWSDDDIADELSEKAPAKVPQLKFTPSTPIKSDDTESSDKNQIVKAAEIKNNDVQNSQEQEPTSMSPRSAATSWNDDDSIASPREDGSKTALEAAMKRRPVLNKFLSEESDEDESGLSDMHIAPQSNLYHAKNQQDLSRLDETVIAKSVEQGKRLSTSDWDDEEQSEKVKHFLDDNEDELNKGKSIPSFVTNDVKVMQPSVKADDDDDDSWGDDPLPVSESGIAERVAEEIMSKADGRDEGMVTNKVEEEVRGEESDWDTEPMTSENVFTPRDPILTQEDIIEELEAPKPVTSAPVSTATTPESRQRKNKATVRDAEDVLAQLDAMSDPSDESFVEDDVDKDVEKESTDNATAGDEVIVKEKLTEKPNEIKAELDKNPSENKPPVDSQLPVRDVSAPQATVKQSQMYDTWDSEAEDEEDSFSAMELPVTSTGDTSNRNTEPAPVEIQPIDNVLVNKNDVIMEESVTSFSTVPMNDDVAVISQSSVTLDKDKKINSANDTTTSVKGPYKTENTYSRADVETSEQKNNIKGMRDEFLSSEEESDVEDLESSVFAKLSARTRELVTSRSKPKSPEASLTKDDVSDVKVVGEKPSAEENRTEKPAVAPKPIVDKSTTVATVLLDQQAPQLKSEAVVTNANIPIQKALEVTPAASAASVHETQQYNKAMAKNMSSDIPLASPQTEVTLHDIQATRLLAAPDEDGLSYTDTEEVVDMGDVTTRPPSAQNAMDFHLQEQLREAKRQCDREQQKRQSAENRLQATEMERDAMLPRLEELNKSKSSLEKQKIELDAKIRTLDHSLSLLKTENSSLAAQLEKSHEQLRKREQSYSVEVQERQAQEMALRNAQLELKSSQSKIEQFEMDVDDVTRQLEHERDARKLQEQLTADLEKKLKDTEKEVIVPIDTEKDEDSGQMRENLQNVQREFNMLNSEFERQRAKFKVDHAQLVSENEELSARVDELKENVRLGDEALAEATLQNSVALGRTQADLGTCRSELEEERAARALLETSLQSARAQQEQTARALEAERDARAQAEQAQQRATEEGVAQTGRSEEQLRSAHEQITEISQRLRIAESKLVKSENEKQLADDTLMQRTAQQSTLQRELEAKRSTLEALDADYHKSKEELIVLRTRCESLQSKETQLKHDKLTLQQQLDEFRSEMGKQRDKNDVRYSEMIENMQQDFNNARSELEGRNNALRNEKEEIQIKTAKKEEYAKQLEDDVKNKNIQIMELDKKLALAQASSQAETDSKGLLNTERSRLLHELDKVQTNYEAIQKLVASKDTQILEMTSKLDKVERQSVAMQETKDAKEASLHWSQGETGERIHNLQMEMQRLESTLAAEKTRNKDQERQLKEGDNMIKAVRKQAKRYKLKLIDEERARLHLESELTGFRASADDVNSLRQKLRAEEHVRAQLESELRRARDDNAQRAAGDERAEGLRKQVTAEMHKELNQKLEQVNKHLEQQAKARSEMDAVREAKETELHEERHKVEELYRNGLRLLMESAANRQDNAVTLQTLAKMEADEMLKEKLRNRPPVVSAMPNGFDSIPQVSNNIQSIDSFLPPQRPVLSPLRNNFLHSPAPSKRYDMLLDRCKEELNRSICKYLEAPYIDRRL